MSTSIAMAGNEGGGGDGSEIRFNEIRADILSWIQKGGPKGLTLPKGITLEEYTSKMKEVLQPKNVILGFVENDDSSDPELRVQVDGTPKTCRGFRSIKDQKLHVLCNIQRFEGTKEDKQYRLVHHEYAGLVGLEKNDGAASDYEISEQLTGYLQKSTVLRLAVKSKVEKTMYGVYELHRGMNQDNRCVENLTIEYFSQKKIKYNVFRDYADNWKILEIGTKTFRTATPQRNEVKRKVILTNNKLEIDDARAACNLFFCGLKSAKTKTVITLREDGDLDFVKTGNAKYDRYYSYENLEKDPMICKYNRK